MFSKEINIIADLHCHTIASDHAYSTVTEIVTYAKKIGLKVVAITDHAPEIGDAPHEWHFSAMKHLLPEIIDGVRLLKGAEVNVLDENGTIDLSEETLEQLDFVVASIHEPVIKTKLPWNSATTTNAYMKLLENKHVDAVGHSGTVGFEYDLDIIIPAVREHGKVIEINENTFLSRPSSVSNCKTIALACKKYSTPIVVNSDAHFHLRVGNFSHCKKMLSEIDFPPELIVNSSEQRLSSFFSLRGVSLDV